MAMIIVVGVVIVVVSVNLSVVIYFWFFILSWLLLCCKGLGIVGEIAKEVGFSWAGPGLWGRVKWRIIYVMSSIYLTFYWVISYLLFKSHKASTIIISPNSLSPLSSIITPPSIIFLLLPPLLIFLFHHPNPIQIHLMIVIECLTTLIRTIFCLIILTIKVFQMCRIIEYFSWFTSIHLFCLILSFSYFLFS